MKGLRKVQSVQMDWPVDPHTYWLEVILWGTSTTPTTPGGRGCYMYVRGECTHTHNRSMYTQLAGLTIQSHSGIYVWHHVHLCLHTNQKPTQAEASHGIFIPWRVCLFSPLHIFIHIWAQSWVEMHIILTYRVHTPGVIKIYIKILVCCYGDWLHILARYRKYEGVVAKLIECFCEHSYGNLDRKLPDQRG